MMSEIDDAPEFIEPLGPPRTFRQLAEAYDWRMGGCDIRVKELEAENAALRAELAASEQRAALLEPFFKVATAAVAILSGAGGNDRPAVISAYHKAYTALAATAPSAASTEGREEGAEQ